jgi:3-hydroxyacyl-CoA dehydrogenase / enoyl-CoA hydratase / 3-hydroxybutyryl-CoA epimerase
MLGAGMMGAGIAYAQASKWHCHRAEGRQPGKCGSKRQRPTAHKLTQGQVDQGPHGSRRATANPVDRSSSPPPVPWQTCKGCDLIIEAVFENRELKAKVTQEVRADCWHRRWVLCHPTPPPLPITGLATAST